jgi:hypothetical protein
MFDYTIKACRGRSHALEDLSKSIVDKWSWSSLLPSILLGKSCKIGYKKNVPLHGRFTIELLLSILDDRVQILTLIRATPIVTWVYKKPSNIDSLIALKQRLIGLLLSSS